jgi:hypothetical protein
MSNRAVFMWLAAALVIGGIALIVLYRPPARGPTDAVEAGQPLLEFSPAAVVSITIATPDDRRDTLLREGDEWVLSTATGRSPAGAGGAAAGAAPPWPVAASSARSFLRLLTDLRSAGVPDPAATVGPAPTTVRITLGDGTARQLAFAERTLGGTVLVLATSIPSPTPGAGGEEVTRRALVSANLLAAIRNPGPRAWRETAALPDLGPDAARFILRSDQRTIALSRVQGQWRLVEPVGAAARKERVDALRGALSKVTITDFLDDRSPESPVTGLEAPALSIAVEADRPGEAGERTAARRWEMALGGPSDSTGRALFARLRTGDGPGRIVAVDAVPLRDLSADPVSYISPAVSAVEPADVGALRLAAHPPPPPDAKSPPPASPSDRHLRRDLARWGDVQPDGTLLLLADADGSSVNDFLALLAAKPAASVLLAPPPGYARAGYLSLHNLSGGALEVIEVGTMSGGAVVFRAGEVYRSHAGDAMPRFFREWLARAGGLTTPPAPLTNSADATPIETIK